MTIDQTRSGDRISSNVLPLRRIRSQLYSPNRLASAGGQNSSYEDYLSAERERMDAMSVLKYGGGFGRKMLYGFTRTLLGEGFAKGVSTIFRDKEKTEEAYRTLTGGNVQRSARPYQRAESPLPAPTFVPQEPAPVPTAPAQYVQQTQYAQQPQYSAPTTPQIPQTSYTQQDSSSINQLESKITEILKVVTDIADKLSPKDLTVNVGGDPQTFRYDPLAPEGRKVTSVTASGKAGRFASRKESASVMMKAAYLSNREPTPEPTFEKVPNNEQAIQQATNRARESLYRESTPQEPIVPQTQIENVQPAPVQTVAPVNQKTYESYVPPTKEENIEEMQKILKYGGRGNVKKVTYAATKALTDEDTAQNAASLTRSVDQIEEAAKRITELQLSMANAPKPTDVPAIPTAAPVAVPQSLQSERIENEPRVNQIPQRMLPQTNELQSTRDMAAEGARRKEESESNEQESEWKQEVLDRLERIEKNLGAASGAGGGMGALALAPLAGIFGASALGGGLGESVGESLAGEDEKQNTNEPTPGSDQNETLPETSEPKPGSDQNETLPPIDAEAQRKRTRERFERETEVREGFEYTDPTTGQPVSGRFVNGEPVGDITIGDEVITPENERYGELVSGAKSQRQKMIDSLTNPAPQQDNLPGEIDLTSIDGTELSTSIQNFEKETNITPFLSDQIPQLTPETAAVGSAISNAISFNKTPNLTSIGTKINNPANVLSSSASMLPASALSLTPGIDEVQKTFDDTTKEYDFNMEENTREQQLSGQQITVVAPQTAPPPMVPPPSSEPSIVVQARNQERSVSTYTTSIFDHPVLYAGLYTV